MWKDRTQIRTKFRIGEIRSFDHSQTDEQLKLTGYGCNRCTWTSNSKGIQDYHKALTLHGKHNTSKHPSDPSAVITLLYKQT